MYKRRHTVNAETPAVSGTFEVDVKKSISRDAILDAFIDELDRRQSTKKTYYYALRQFFQYLDSSNLQLGELSRKDIVDYKNHLMGDANRHSALTVSTYLAAIKQFYKWAETERYYPNIANGISIPKNREYYVKEHLTKEECLELFDYLRNPQNDKERKYVFKNAEQMRLRDFTMVYLMVWTGLRTIEVSRLDVGDIVYKGGVRVLRVWGKGHDGKDDFVSLPDDVYRYVEQYLATRPGAAEDEPLFVGEGYGAGVQRLTTRRIQQICKDALRGIGLDSHAYSAHSLRHTTAVQILLNGGDMYDVFYALRHVDPAVSQKYVKSIEQQRRLEMAPTRFLQNALSIEEEK